MNILTLNRDVIDIILSCISPGDAGRLSLTCHDAYNIAMPRFLSEVILQHEQQAISFCSFMLANPTLRIRCLKHLTLLESVFAPQWTISVVDKTTPTSSLAGMRRHAATSVFSRWYMAPSPLFITPSVEKNTTVSSLAEVIRQATRLCKMYLHLSYNTTQESFLEHFLPLADAIAALPSLDDIFIYDANASALQLLSCVKSHPRHHITLYSPQNIGESGNDLPMHPLDNTALSLLAFVDSLVTLNLDGHHIFSRTLQADSVWPALHELNLCRTTIDLTSISTACPNLHTLHIDRCKLTDPHASLHLPKLDFLKVDYPLPLSTRVRRLYLVNFKANITLKIESMLQQANPVVLTCYLTMANTMAIAKVCPHLQDLRVVVPQERGLDDVLKILCPLRETPIQSIMFQTDHLTTCTMEPFALKVAALIPTVEYIGHGYVGGVYRWYLPLVESIPWYQVVTRPDGELPKLRKLSFDEGDKIHQDLPEIRRYVIDWSGDPPHSIVLP